MSQEFLDYFEIQDHPGYIGPFSRRQDGDIPNGTRVEKCLWHAGDTRAVGELGTVLGSIWPVRDIPPLYFIEWDTQKGWAVGIRGDKIRRAS